MRHLFCIAAGLLFAPLALSADAVHTVDARLTKEKKKSDRAVEPLGAVTLHVWVPGGGSPLRGAVVNPFNDKAVGQKHWQEACRLWGFAVVGANYFGVDKAEYGKTLADGLADLGKQLKRPELANLPLCFVGMSAGGGMSVQFAEQLPDRTIAAAPVCLEVGPTTAAGRGIPTLTVFGEKDGKQMEQLLAKLPEARKDGALWAIAPQWGRKHEFGAANNLVIPFFDSCISLRLPRDADPGKGPVMLAELKEKDGWVGSWGGNPAKGSIHKFADAPQTTHPLSWFPDPRTAAVWQAFVEQKPELSIEEPAGLGDGQPFTPLGADKGFTLKAKTTHPRTFVRDGPFQIAATEFIKGDPKAVKIEKLAPGIHTLILYADDAKDAGFGPSRPVTVIVPKGK
jgi:hypothetical protein